MLLEVPVRNRDLPPSLVIVTPSQAPSNPEAESSSHQPQPSQIPSLPKSFSLPSQGIMASPTEKRSRIDLGAVWKRASRGSGAQDQDAGLGGSMASVNSSPSSPSPSSPSQSRLWNIRRAVSASSTGPGSPQSPVDSNSPTSPQGFQRRPSRISSFIRRHHSTPRLEDSQDRGIPPSLLPGIPPVQRNQLPYNNSSSQPILNHNLNSSPYSSSHPASHSQWLLHTLPNTTYSPVAPNPFQEWESKPRPRTASSSPIVSSMNKPLPPLPRPLEDFPNPLTLNTQQTSTPVIIESPKAMETEAEGFTSPTEFALFAEATSSFSFLPSTFEAVPSPTPSPQPYSQQQTYPSQSHSQTLPLPPRHHIPLPQLITPRSRSVPSASGPSHHRSSSSSAPMPMPVRRSSPPQQQLLPRGSPQPPTRAQLLAEALEGIDDDDERGRDDELPDYATSQAEASAKQRNEATRRARELEENWLRGRAERVRKPWRAWDRDSNY
jgi:hypothetical protein